MREQRRKRLRRDPQQLESGHLVQVLQFLGVAQHLAQDTQHVVDRLGAEPTALHPSLDQLDIPHADRIQALGSQLGQQIALQRRPLAAHLTRLVLVSA